MALDMRLRGWKILPLQSCKQLLNVTNNMRSCHRLFSTTSDHIGAATRRLILPPRDKKVCVLMSGGVDSAVCASLLKSLRYDLHAVFLKNWNIEEEDDETRCTAETDWLDVQNACQHLDIPCSFVDLSKQYWMDVFQPFLDGLSQNETPNPDVLCNQRIKFDSFLDVAKERGFGTVVTGHFARLRRRDDRLEMLRAADRHKDQSYFLFARVSPLISRSGNLTKQAIRDVANQVGLSKIAAKRSSRGICFIGKRNFGDFLSNFVTPRDGVFVHEPDGLVLGEHDNVLAYTVGQRARIGGSSEKLYVIDKNVDTGTVLVGPASSRALYTVDVPLRDFVWIGGAPPAALLQARSLAVRCQQSSTSESVACRVTPLGSADERCRDVRIQFDTAQPRVGAGQLMALYDADDQVCLGGGVVTARTKA